MVSGRKTEGRQAANLKSFPPFPFEQNGTWETKGVMDVKVPGMEVETVDLGTIYVVAVDMRL